MMLYVEVEKPGGTWHVAGQIADGDPPGSLSHNRADGGRDIFVFGLEDPPGRGLVWRSSYGADALLGDNDEFRVVTSGGGEVMAELRNPGDTYEVELQTDRSPEPRKVRFILRGTGW